MMKKTIAFLFAALAVLSASAGFYLLIPQYRIGDGVINDNDGRIVLDPSNGAIFDSDSLGGKTNCTLYTTIPAGLQFSRWWYYYKSSASVETTNTEWVVGTTNCNWVYNSKIKPYNNLPINIVADFDYIKYTLNYNANTGSGSMSSESHVYTNIFNLAENAFEKTGYTFAGWTNSVVTTALEDGAQITDGSTFGVTYTNTATTLYANWNPNTYDVTLNPGFETDLTNVVQATYDSAWPSLAVPNREGHRFLGWFTSENGGSEINTNSTYTTANNSTIYAHWIKRVAATFNDGRTGGTISKLEIDAGQTPVVPQAPDHTGDGYYFTGWVPAVGAIYNDTTYTAEYSPYTYTVVFHADNGTGATQTQSFTYNDSQSALNTVEALKFSRVGYSFQNWTNSTGVAFNDGQQVSNLAQSGEYHLYAVWSPIHYTMEFDGCDATGGSVGSIDAVYDVEYQIPENGYEKAGLDFKRWRLGTNGGAYYPGNMVSNLTITAGDTVTFYAVWSEPRYISFDGNGATATNGVVEVVKFEGIETKPLPGNVFEKTGYTFGGWATNETDAAALSVKYNDGAEVSSANLAGAIGDTNEFFAVWTTNTYTVAFNPNCKKYTGEMESQEFVYDQAQYLTANAFVNEAGLHFSGWSNTVTGVTYSDGAAVSNLTAEANGTVALNAIWDNGELSKAMHCDNLYWDDHPNYATVKWTAKFAEDVGHESDSCANATKLAYMVVTVRTNGVLRFWWKSSENNGPTVVKHPDLKTAYNPAEHTVKQLKYFENDSDADKSYYGTWTDSGDIAIPVGVMYLGLRCPGSTECSIDQLTWTPADASVEPTEDDKPVISGFESATTETGSGFKIQISNASSDFDYQILGTNVLTTTEEWPVIETLSGSEMNDGYTIEFDEDEPQMFYKVKVISK